MQGSDHPASVAGRNAGAQLSEIGCLVLLSLEQGSNDNELDDSSIISQRLISEMN